MAIFTLGFLLFAAVLIVAAIFVSLWMFIKMAHLLGQIVGLLLRGMFNVLCWLAGSPRQRNMGPRRIVTADGTFALPPRTPAGVRGAQGAYPSPGSLHYVAGAPRTEPGEMVRCVQMGCHAPNPADAIYCRRCGRLMGRQTVELRRREIAVPA